MELNFLTPSSPRPRKDPFCRQIAVLKRNYCTDGQLPWVLSDTVAWEGLKSIDENKDCDPDNVFPSTYTFVLSSVKQYLTLIFFQSIKFGEKKEIASLDFNNALQPTASSRLRICISRSHFQISGLGSSISEFLTQENEPKSDQSY